LSQLPFIAIEKEEEEVQILKEAYDKLQSQIKVYKDRIQKATAKMASSRTAEEDILETKKGVHPGFSRKISSH
jgi:uncharacterized protein YlxW (UPF0749 family)